MSKSAKASGAELANQSDEKSLGEQPMAEQKTGEPVPPSRRCEGHN